MNSSSPRRKRPISTLRPLIRIPLVLPRSRTTTSAPSCVEHQGWRDGDVAAPARASEQANLPQDGRQVPIYRVAGESCPVNVDDAHTAHRVWLACPAEGPRVRPAGDPFDGPVTVLHGAPHEIEM